MLRTLQTIRPARMLTAALCSDAAVVSLTRQRAGPPFLPLVRARPLRRAGGDTLVPKVRLVH